MQTQNQSFLRKNLPLLAILFLTGIIFLCFAEYDSTKGNEKLDFDPKAYTEDLEQRLCAMLDKMEGVEDASVMVTLESGSTYQIKGTGDYKAAQDTFVSSVLTGGSTSSEPLLVELAAPKIKGVSVVCSGAENIQTRERIIDLIAGTLNLTKNKIYVTQ